MFYLLALILTLIDQVSKVLVRLHMDVGDSHLVREGLLTLTYYQNTGAAGSSFQGYARLFGIFAVAFIAAVFFYRRKRTDGARRSQRLQDAGFAFLIAGAAGNGIERLLFGKVTDFLQFGSHGGILNIADLFINIGVLLVLVQQLFFTKREKASA